MSRQQSHDWPSEVSSRRVLWAVVQVFGFTAVFLTVSMFAGDRLAELWWLCPLVLMPFMMLSNRLSEHVGAVERASRVLQADERARRALRADR